MDGLRIKDFLAREGERLGIRKQEELAEKLGVSDQTVSNWVKGKTFPTHETEYRLLEMGMTVEELFGKPYNQTEKKTTLELDEEAKDALRRLFRNVGL